MSQSQKRKSKQHRPPMRRCAGCMESRPQQDMIRIVLEDGKLIPDPDRTRKGRGVYLCLQESCWQSVKKRHGFSRAFRQNIPEEVTDQVLEQIRGMTEEGGPREE